jgi:hypothetical protein
MCGHQTRERYQAMPSSHPKRAPIQAAQYRLQQIAHVETQDPYLPCSHHIFVHSLSSSHPPPRRGRCPPVLPSMTSPSAFIEHGEEVGACGRLPSQRRIEGTELQVRGAMSPPRLFPIVVRTRIQPDGRAAGKSFFYVS